MQLTLMRHGLPVRGAVNAADPELDPAGLDQIRATAEVLIRDRFDAVYSSPQLRARQTAELVTDVLDLPLILDDGLVEFDHGAPYIHYDDGTAPVWQRYSEGDLSPWGLTAAEFHGRITQAFDSIADRHPAGRVLAICHGGVINAWSCQLFGVPDRLRVLEPDYASLHTFSRRAQRWSVVSLNQTAFNSHHLL